MYLEEKLNKGIYIMRRTVQNYRVVVWTKSEVKEDIDYRKGMLEIEEMKSLCEYTSEVLGIEHDDSFEFPEIVKEMAMCVLSGHETQESVIYWAKENEWI